VPAIDQVRAQSTSNKQGRADEAFPIDEAERIIAMMESSQQQAYAEYQQMLSQDLAREIARINLPVSNYTEWYWKIDLHNLFHFLRLRIDAHAQYEIRVYAQAMADLIKPYVPMAYEAFEDYILKSQRFSRLERIALNALLQQRPTSVEDLAAYGLKGREATEFLDKLNDLDTL
jgi:thymidylate synthase (FAD)